MQVDLRAVEGAVALVDAVVEVVGLERRLERALRVVPQLVGADPLLGTGGELDLDVEPDQVVGRERELQAAGDLLLDLLLGAEDVASSCAKWRTRISPCSVPES